MSRHACPRCNQVAGNRFYPHTVMPKILAVSIMVAHRRRPPDPIRWIVCEACDTDIRAQWSPTSR